MNGVKVKTVGDASPFFIWALFLQKGDTRSERHNSGGGKIASNSCKSCSSIISREYYSRCNGNYFPGANYELPLPTTAPCKPHFLCSIHSSVHFLPPLLFPFQPLFLLLLRRHREQRLIGRKTRERRADQLQPELANVEFPLSFAQSSFHRKFSFSSCIMTRECECGCEC